MRREREVLDLLLDVAYNDERIRAVIMNGSRVNPHARADPFQDFDVVYLVTDITPFRRNHEWIKRFGEVMILQLPDDMGEEAPLERPGYAYLMQFTDGSRVDLTIYPLEHLPHLRKDSLSILLLDKDRAIGAFPPPSESSYLPRPPTAKQFADCCNEFWWVCPYVAKGIWREQLTYARYMLDHVLRDELMKMLTWYIGLRTSYSRNPGLFGKYFEQYLEPQLWQLLKQTYSPAEYATTWDALFAMCTLFRSVAVPTAEHFGFPYLQDEDARVSAYLLHVRQLPKGAVSIY